MIERIYILESVDPVIFYGVNNSNRHETISRLNSYRQIP